MSKKILNPTEKVQNWMKDSLKTVSSDQQKKMKPADIAKVHASNVDFCEKKLADMSWRFLLAHEQVKKAPEFTETE